MKNIKLAFLISCITLIQGNTQPQTDYFVGFFAEGLSVTSPTIGHAFIGIGKGVPLTCDINGSETLMVGFYPKVRLEGVKSIWFGPVDAEVKDDTRTKIDCYVFKKISFADYIKVNLKIEEWKKKKYELTRQDCISFFIDVASTFEDVVLPDRTKFATPEGYVKQFVTANKGLR